MEKVNTNFTCLYSNPPVTLTHLTALVSDTRHGDAAALATALVAANKNPPKLVRGATIVRTNRCAQAVACAAGTTAAGRGSSGARERFDGAAGFACSHNRTAGETR